MAKGLNFTLDGRAVVAALGTKIDKKSLYGFAKRVVERDGVPLTRGNLSPTGELLRSGEIATAKVDPDGSLVEDPVSEIDGKPAELHPSSFDTTSPLVPMPLTTLASFCAKDVYPLLDVILPEGLYQTTFAYRKSHQPADALVLARKDGAFLLAGTFKASAFVAQAVVYDFFDAVPAEDDGEEEGLDFAML